MSLLLRRGSCLSISRPCRVGGFATPERRAPFCSSSSLESPDYDPGQWYDYEEDNVRYEPKTSKSVHVVLSPLLDLKLRHAAGLTPKHNRGLHVPNRFPFTIVDNPGEETIILKREFDRESIVVMVYMPDMVRGSDDQCNGNDRNSGQHIIPFNASVVKDDGHRMEFYCRLFSNDVKIDKVQLKGPEDACHEDSYVGPDFPHLDKKVERMFVEYLEMRGIETSLAGFLQDYMTEKYSKEYAMWSERLKEILQSDPSLELNTKTPKGVSFLM